MLFPFVQKIGPQGAAALRQRVDGGVHGFWIGTHAEYDRLVDA